MLNRLSQIFIDLSKLLKMVLDVFLIHRERALNLWI